jgi:hypothetical protein
LFGIVWELLIQKGRHPLFRVWKGPCPLDNSDEEWVEASRVPMQRERQPVDTCVNVEQLLDDLFPCANEDQDDVGDIGEDHVLVASGMEELGMV